MRSLIWALPDYSWRIHAWILLTAFTFGFIMISSGFIRLSGRMLLALGLRQFSPLVESVQEHSPLPFSAIISEYGIALVIVLAGIVLLAYKVYSNNRWVTDGLIATLFLLTFMLVYANVQLAYFTQMASYLASVGAGISVGLFLSLGVRPGERPPIDDLKIIGVAAIIVVMTFSSVYYTIESYQTNNYRAAQILTSGLPSFRIAGDRIVVPLNDAWTRALEYIRENTSEDALIVSWWDYGYWITVNTGRRTVADGATFDEGQIRLLARILTGGEDEASRLLTFLGAEPNNTYIVFYDVFLGVMDKNRSSVTLYPYPRENRLPDSNVWIINHGIQDLGKSFQMLRIGYRIDPFADSPYLTSYSSEVVAGGTRIIHFPGFVGTPEANVTNVLRDTLIYRMTMEGIYALATAGVFGEACGFLEDAQLFFPAVKATTGAIGSQLQPIITLESLSRFQPEAIIVGCPAGLVFDQGDRIEFYAVIVYIYKWVG